MKRLNDLRRKTFDLRNCFDAVAFDPKLPPLTSKNILSEVYAKSSSYFQLLAILKTMLGADLLSESFDEKDFSTWV